MIVDNSYVIALSLRVEIQAVLDETEWKNRYNIYLAGDESLRNKELVVRANYTDSNKQICLPLVVISFRGIRHEDLELGNSQGLNIIDAEILVYSFDTNSVSHLVSVIRNFLRNESFVIKNYMLPHTPSVATASISREPDVQDISNPDASNIANRFVQSILFEIEVTGQQLI